MVALLLLISATPALANIGSINQLRGNGEVVRRTTTVSARPQLPIEKMDRVQTGNGRLEIKFVDQTTVKVTEHSKLIIDDFVYSGKPSTSRMALKFASGTVRFATGKGIAKPNINLRTPTATIAVRGTDFTSTVDDFGKSLVILLPEEDGTVGEITVSNAGGTVILTRAFQATVVSTYDSAPSKPVILNLTLDMIDNMLIVSPPAIREDEDEEVGTKSNILDLSELDIDYLKNNDLEERDLADSAIDVLSINNNFLEDALLSIGDLSDTKDGVKITGTTFGLNEYTQINTIIEQDKVRFIRNVGTTFDIAVDRERGSNLKIDVGNRIFDLQVNDGGTIINVKQNN